LAERWQSTLDEAFDALRQHARAHRQTLAGLCQQLIDGTLNSSAIQRP
ncbi:ANTAR domain-containing protein, partial [Streptomyces sp. NPDC054855]